MRIVKNEGNEEELRNLIKADRTQAKMGNRSEGQRNFSGAMQFGQLNGNGRKRNENDFFFQF